VIQFFPIVLGNASVLDRMLPVKVPLFSFGNLFWGLVVSARSSLRTVSAMVFYATWVSVFLHQLLFLFSFVIGRLMRRVELMLRLTWYPSFIQRWGEFRLHLSVEARWRNGALHSDPSRCITGTLRFAYVVGG
jgi:hypothetical protein